MKRYIVKSFEGVAKTTGILMNSAIQIERSRHLEANPYEQTDARRNFANACRLKTIKK